jgi:sugar lactone lactonase YvrE
VPARRFTPLVDRFEGKRFNSPNDLVFSSDGTLYFTDPPYGLTGTFDDPGREIDTRPLRATGPGAPDGMKVDAQGNVFTTGPGGVLVLTARGEHLGTIVTGVPTANCAFGGPDGATLYITANDKLCRVRTVTKGLGF